jgi:hypothetical protein
MDEFLRLFDKKNYQVLSVLRPHLVSKPIFIAGGSVLQAFLLDPWEDVNDVDVFVYAATQEEATNVCEDIWLSLKEAYSGLTLHITRAAHVVNIHVTEEDCGYDDLSELRIQIILRLYASPSEILFGFDVDCCCIGFDAHQVWASPRCLHAIRNRVNILNPLHAWPNKPSYELRLIKYASRGFGIEIPGYASLVLDHDKIMQTKFGTLFGLARLLHIIFMTEGVLTRSGDTANAFGNSQVGETGISLTWVGKQVPEAKFGFNMRSAWYEPHIEPAPSIYRANQPDELRKLSHLKVMLFDRNEMRNSNWPGEYHYQYHGDPWDCKKTEMKKWASYIKQYILFGPDDVFNVTDRPDLKISCSLRDAWDTSRKSREYLNDVDALTCDLNERYYKDALKTSMPANWKVDICLVVCVCVHTCMCVCMCVCEDLHMPAN